MTNPTTSTTCPYLGLDVDRTVMLDEPTPDHRCYGSAPPTPPNTACQMAFCLSADHVSCSTFQAASQSLVTAGGGQVPFRAPRRPAPPVLPPPQSRRWPLFVTISSIGLVLCLILAVIAVNAWGLRPLRALTGMVNLAVSPTATSIQQPIIVDTVLLITPTTGPPAETTSAQAEVAATVPAATPTAPAQLVAQLSTPATSPVAAIPTAASVRTRFATPTAEPGGQVLALQPLLGNAGWWKDNDTRRNNLGDSYLYAGTHDSETFISAVQFDLARVPRGASIRHATLRLTGLRQDQFQPDAEGVWLVQLVPESSLVQLNTADFLTMLSAPAAFNLFPPLNAGDLAPDQVNEWELDATMRQWLEQQLLNGATKMTLRIQAAVEQGEALFAWDSGLGPDTGGDRPTLLLSLGPPPPTPPPLPTKPVIVATFTPVPDDVLTVVAQAKTATAVALTTGTHTPIPYDIVTPTPFPANLATVQARALLEGFPPVVLNTATPVNLVAATRQAEYATAVAVTTGTFTPVPTGYVTPILIYPSPPPENVATEAARKIAATAFAASGAATPTPLPHNGVFVNFVYATPVPENEGTAIANAVIATANANVNGTPTPLSWNDVVITAVPTPTETPLPTATPLPVVQSAAEFTPTWTPIPPEDIPDVLPAELRGRILFRTNRNAREEIYALDPGTGELYRINQSWVYPLAQRQIGVAPGGQQRAIVQAASNGILQIHIFSAEYNTTRQLTAFTGNGVGRAVVNYDPDWSPTGGQIVFVSTNSGNDEIYSITTDGSIVTQLTNNSYEWDKHPSWSPDGSQIVFYSNRESGRRQLWIMNADGSGQRNLSSNDYEDWDPIWIR